MSFRLLVFLLFFTILSSGCAEFKDIARSSSRGHEHESERKTRISVARTASTDMLASLRPTHPRLMMTHEDFERVRDISSGKDELASAWQRRLRARAEKYLDDPPVAFAHPLISASREAFIRI